MTNPTAPTDLTNPTRAIECDDALLLSAAAAERTLEPGARAALDRHLAHCATCRDASSELAEEDEWVSVVRVPLRAVEREAAPAASADLANLPIVDPSLYTWGETIGQGGMGRVVAARDRRLGRQVAIKELLTDHLETRFANEALITARLQHPAIVNVHEAGRWPSGEPFYTMKLVTGSSLSQVIREQPTLAARMALLPSVMAVADAIAYAHSERIIHRDLKPSNVVLGPFGETVVIDWGLAKDLRDVGATPLGPFRDADDGATQAGLGTPQYMPPEQARGETPDERVDVYALGATLYHLIDGEPPYQRGTAAELLTRLAQGAPTPIAVRQPDVPRELAAIVDKAMARDPALRYADARALADDLRRFQAGQLVGAFRYSPWALVERWVARHRAAVVAAAIALVVAVAGATLSVRKILVERRRAEVALTAAERERAATLVEQGRTELLAGKPMRALPYLTEAFRTVHDDRTRILLGEAMRSVDGRVADLDIGAGIDALALSPDGRQLAVAAGGRLELRAVVAGASADDAGGAVVALAGHTEPVTAIAWSDDGRLVVSASLDNTVRRWGADGRARGMMNGHGNAVRTVAMGADGTARSAGDDGTIRSWDGRDDEGRVLFATPTGARWRAGDPAQPGAVLERQYSIGAPRLELVRAQPPETPDVAIPSIVEHVRDIERLAVRGEHVALTQGTRLWLWNASTPTAVPELAGHAAAITQLHFTRDGAWLLSGDAAGALLLWDVARHVLVGRVAAHDGTIDSIAVDGGGTRVATGGADGIVRVWRMAALQADAAVATDELEAGDPLVLGGETVRTGPTSSASTRVLRTSAAGVEVWDPVQQRTVAYHAGTPHDSAYAADGQAVATVLGEDVALWDPETGTDRATLRGHADLVTTLAFDAGSGDLVTASRDGTARLWRRDGRALAVMRGHTAAIERLKVSGETILTAGLDGAVRRWRLADGTALGVVAAHVGPVNALTLSPDGRRAASAGEDGTVHIWRTADGAHELTIAPDHGPMRNLAFSADGALLATGTADGVVELWEVEGGTLLLRRLHRRASPAQVVFTPAGAVLTIEGQRAHRWVIPRETRTPDEVARAHDRRASWQLMTGRLVARPRPPRMQPRGVEARPDMTYDFAGLTVVPEAPPPDSAVNQWATTVAAAGSPAATALAQVADAAPEARATRLAALVDRYADVARLDDALVVSERLLAAAPPSMLAVAHARRARLARLTGDPERAMAESLAAGLNTSDLSAMATSYYQTFRKTRDERYGKAAGIGYRALSTRPGIAEAATALVTLPELERSLAASTTAGGADKAGIRNVFLDRMPAFAACYRQVRGRDPTTHGTIQLRLSLRSDGTIRDLRLSPVPGERGLAAVARCSERVLQGARFPSVRWAAAILVYVPLSFELP